METETQLFNDEMDRQWNEQHANMMSEETYLMTLQAKMEEWRNMRDNEQDFVLWEDFHNGFLEAEAAFHEQ